MWLATVVEKAKKKKKHLHLIFPTQQSDASSLDP
jgi:hypothetical protein